MQRIIHPIDTGIMVLTPNMTLGLTVTEIALKDVPEGVPYKIISVNDLPDRSNRDAWEVDFSEPDGYGGA
jgi:hypothetical protein